MEDDGRSIGSEFDSLTNKQVDVLDLLAEGRTTKEIASALDLSGSAVNRHIELIRTRFGGITRLELARRYRDRPTRVVADVIPCVETDRQRLHLAEVTENPSEGVRDDREVSFQFRDALKIRIEPPWTKREPQVVPRVLDGENAALTRGVAIAIILLAIVASLVLGLAAAQAITDVLGS